LIFFIEVGLLSILPQSYIIPDQKNRINLFLFHNYSQKR